MLLVQISVQFSRPSASLLCDVMETDVFFWKLLELELFVYLMYESYLDCNLIFV